MDVYGGCGTMTCLRSDFDRCRQLLNDDYKFYLSFENSNCDYYITEKFYENGLRSVSRDTAVFATRQCGCGNAFGRVCLSVCPVRAVP